MAITDALEAGGLENFGLVPERGVLDAKVGVDLLLYSAKTISEGIDGSVRHSRRRWKTNRPLGVEALGRVSAAPTDAAAHGGYRFLRAQP